MAWYDEIIEVLGNTGSDIFDGIISILTKEGADGTSLDLEAILPILLGIGSASGLFDKEQKPVGWQGSIDRRQAVRDQVPSDYSGDRMPGQTGQRYFTDVEYVDPNDAEAVAAAEAASESQAAELDAENRANREAQQAYYDMLGSLYSAAAADPQGNQPPPSQPPSGPPPQTPAPAPAPGQGGTYPDDPTPPNQGGGGTPPTGGGGGDYQFGPNPGIGGLTLGGYTSPYQAPEGGQWSFPSQNYNPATGQYESDGMVWMGLRSATPEDIAWLKQTYGQNVDVDEASLVGRGDADYSSAWISGAGADWLSDRRMPDIQFEGSGGTKITPDTWSTNSNFIQEQVASGTASQSQQDWYDRWVASGSPTNKYDMMSKEEYASRYAQGGPVGGIKNLFMGGATDGMADQIPAHINGQAPAALSDGEFVVPADVVSHLGNGNSAAGAKQLSDMMKRVRTARTGQATQGPRIDPNKLMPR